MCVARGGGVYKYFKFLLFLSTNSSYEVKYKETPLTAMLIPFPSIEGGETFSKSVKYNIRSKYSIKIQ